LIGFYATSLRILRGSSTSISLCGEGVISFPKPDAYFD
jgi:hypothetical protein